MNDCVFCNIVNKTIPKQLLFEDSEFIAFKDVLPKAPIHMLVVTKDHIPSIHHLGDGRQELVGNMIYVAKRLAEKIGIGDSGYKLVFNVGHDGGQVIPHLHLHLLGGKHLGE